MWQNLVTGRSVRALDAVRARLALEAGLGDKFFEGVAGKFWDGFARGGGEAGYRDDAGSSQLLDLTNAYAGQ